MDAILNHKNSPVFENLKVCNFGNIGRRKLQVI